MSYAMYGIEAFNEQEAAEVCKTVAFKVAEIERIIEACDADVRPIVKRKLRQAYPTPQPVDRSQLALIEAMRPMDPFERQRLEMLRGSQANLPASHAPNPILGGIFGSIF